MADETTTAETTENAPPEAPPERTVPYDRFKSVNDAAKQAKHEADELRQRLEELEDRDKSETERERKAREKAEARLQELESAITQRDRADLLRRAARDAKFEDPDDAVVWLKDADIADEASAARAVKDLAKRKPKLIQNEGEAPPPEIGQVVKNGQRVEGTGEQVSQVEQEAAAVWQAIQAAKGQTAA